jgi:hypothetical protein
MSAFRLSRTILTLGEQLDAEFTRMAARRRLISGAGSFQDVAAGEP